MDFKLKENEETSRKYSKILYTIKNMTPEYVFKTLTTQ
jgi:hypothetical protein